MNRHDSESYTCPSEVWRLPLQIMMKNPLLTIESGKSGGPPLFLERGDLAKKMFHQLVTFGKNDRA